MKSRIVLCLGAGAAATIITRALSGTIQHAVDNIGWTSGLRLLVLAAVNSKNIYLSIHSERRR